MIPCKVKRKTILRVSRLVQLLALLPQGLQLQRRLPQVQFHWPMQGPRIANIGNLKVFNSGEECQATLITGLWCSWLLSSWPPEEHI